MKNAPRKSPAIISGLKPATPGYRVMSLKITADEYVLTIRPHGKGQKNNRFSRRCTRVWISVANGIRQPGSYCIAVAEAVIWLRDYVACSMDEAIDLLRLRRQWDEAVETASPVDVLKALSTIRP